MLQRLLFVPWDLLIDVQVYALPDRKGPEPAYVITQCAACSEEPDVFFDVTSQPHTGKLHVLRAGYHEVSVFFDKRDRIALRLSVVAHHEAP